jgi:O-antigen ligase
MTSAPAAFADAAPARLLTTAAAGLLVALAPAMWLANRSSPLFLALAAAACLAAALATRDGAGTAARLRSALASPVGLALSAFLLWALVSLSWSHRTWPAGLQAWGELALPLAGGVVLAASRRLVLDRRLLRALALALLATAALVLGELAIGIGERVALGLGKTIERIDIFNRPVLTCVVLSAAILPMLWRRSAAWSPDRALVVAAGLAVGFVTWSSQSGSAKFGLAVLVAVWLLARLAPRLALALVALGFAATMLLSPVIGRLTDAAMPASLHQALADSHSRARVDIWLSFGEAIAARPWLGSGFGASASLEKHPVAAAVSPARRGLLAVGHPHSAPIQAWTETGAVGAALLAIAGFGLLARLRRLPAALLAPRLALFAAAFAVASVAHGAWQGWWWAALALAATLFWLDAAPPFEPTREDAHD